MKTDHFECLRSSSLPGEDLAGLNRIKIAHSASVTEETTMLSANEKLEKVVLVGQDDKKTEDEIEVLVTETLFTIRKYLSSWVFRDIGPVTARNIVAAFGLRTVQVIKSSPHELMNVRGVGKKRMLAVLHGWTFQRKLIKNAAELMKLTLSDE